MYTVVLPLVSFLCFSGCLSSIKGQAIVCKLSALMNDSLVESTLTFRLCSNPNPRLGFYLLGFLKPVRFQPKHYTRTISLRFPCSLHDSIGGMLIGRAFSANIATEEPHQVVFRATRFSALSRDKCSSFFSLLFSSSSVCSCLVHRMIESSFFAF